MPVAQIPNRLVIFSGVDHHWVAEHYVAHRGFVREVDIWARLFERVLVITRQGSNIPRSDDVPYSENNIVIHPLRGPEMTEGVSGKLKLALTTPHWWWQSRQLLAADDVIMARGPDSMGFLGWLITRFNRRPRFAKYADQWRNFSDEPFGYRLQKIAYRSKSFGGPVMIYGSADASRPHLVPFYTSGVTYKEWLEAGKLIEDRPIPPPYRLLFVGRFVYFKGIDIFLEAVKILRDQSIDIWVDLVGDGPEAGRLKELTATYLLDNVHFHGWLGPTDLARCYSQAHIFVHPSRKEGYGKVLIEAMSYGLPIVGTDIGLSREIVEKKLCGLIIEPNDPKAMAQALLRLLSGDDLRSVMGHQGRSASRKLLLENLETSYRAFVKTHLGL